MKQILCAMLVALAFASCAVNEDGGPSEPEVYFDQEYYDSSTDSIVTGRAEDVTAYSAKITSRFSIPTSRVKTGWTWGVAVSEDPEPDPVKGNCVVFASKLRQISFAVVASGLKMNTRYYYRAYLKEGAKTYKMGRVMYFTTRPIRLLTSDAEVHSAFSATIGGWTDVNLKDENFVGELGVLFSRRQTDKPNVDYDSFITCKPLDGDSANFRVKVNGLEENRTYVYQAYVKTDSVYTWGKVLSFTTKKLNIDLSAEVDLGLDVNWASKNLGAEHHWDAGNFYGYGEVTGTIFSKRLADYSGLQDLRGSVDDMVSIAYGDTTWTMPSWDDVAELRAKCDWQWVSIQDVPGYVVTGPSGSSIFLPVTGYTLDGSNVLGNTTSNPAGYYWTGTRNDMRDTHAYDLYFDVEGVVIESHQRYFGFAARGVKAKK